MKKYKKAFTVIEIVTVIAVIGIVAAILVLALPKAIDEAHEKSAMSDAKNAVTKAHTENTGEWGDDLLVISEKYDSMYLFTGKSGTDELVPFDANPINATDPDALIKSLCDLHMIYAPLGTVRYDRVTDYDNVTIYSGGKLADERTDKQKRIDIEKGKSENVPVHGILNMSWSVENPFIASVEGDVISAKACGKTKLTASCGNLRLEYPLYVGESLYVSSFSEMKRAVETGGYDSVFIHPDPDLQADSDGIMRLTPEKDELPLTVHGDIFVSLSRDDGYFGITYNIRTESDCVDALIINDGGIIEMHDTSVGLYYESVSEEEIKFIPLNGDCIFNTNAGIVRVYGESFLGKSSFIPAALFAPVMYRYEDYMQAKITERGFALNNENGTAEIDITLGVDTIRNGESGFLSLNGGRVSAIENYGIISEIKDTQFICVAMNDMRDRIIDNYGTLFSMEGCTFLLTKGTTGIIVEDGAVARIADCSFRQVKYRPDDSALKDISEEAKEKYFALDDATCIFVEKGRVGQISDAVAGDEKASDRMKFIASSGTPVKCIMSGVFTNKPDDRFLAEGSICSFNDSEKMYKVENENN